MGNDLLRDVYKAEIMIVDDTIENLTLLNELFKSEGFRVRSSNSGELALLSIAKKAPDLILLDIKMPQLDGFEVCKRLKADEKTKNIPIIFITALDETQDRIEAFNLGATDFITKPFDRQEVIVRVRAHIRFRIQQLQLEESEEKFKYIFDNSLIGKSITLTSGEINVNLTMCEMLGYTANELKGKMWQEITFPDDIEKTQLEVNALLSGEKKSARFTKRYQKKDGSFIWADVLSSIRKDADGNPLYLITSVIDITDRINSQKALKKSEERFRTAQEMSPDGFTIFHPERNEMGEVIDFTWVYENQAVARINQTEPQKVIGKRLLDLFPEHSGTAIFETYKNVTITGESQIIEEVYVGEIISKPTWLRLVIVPMSEDIAILAQDITQRKNLDYELKQSEERFRALFEQAPLAYMSVDIEGRFIEVNQKWQELLGYAKEEVIGKWFGDFLPTEGVEGFRQRFTIFKKQGHIQSEFDMLTKDGCKLTVAFEGRVSYNAEGEFKRTYGILQDVTEKRKAEKELAHSYDLMRYIIEHNRSGVAIHDRDLKYLYVSQRYLDEYKIEETDIIGKHHYEVFPDLPQKWRDIHQKALKGEIFSAENDPFVRNDGSLEWTRWECRPWYEYNGSIGGIVVYTEVITDYVKLLGDLKEKEYNLRVAQEIAHVGSFDYELISENLVCSDEGLRICGITQKEFSGKADAIIQFIHPEEREYAVQLNLDAIAEKRVIASNLRIIRPNGEERVVDFRVGPVYDGNGNCVRTTGTIQDITERKKAEDDLIYLSNHDHLTELYNRRFFEQELKRLDMKENLPLSIIMCDINGLKLINDSFGHELGDMLLIKASETIKNASKEDNIISRIGGDEFAILLPNTDFEEAANIANHIKELAAEQKVYHIEISISCGYDTKETDDQSINEILANAENNMYKHKLYERSSMRSNTIDLIMKTLFEKSNRESQHSGRVSSICQVIASIMGFNRENVDKMRIAGLLHDIGKIGVDEKVLNKDGRLTDNELIEIKKHPEIGWRILSTTNEFLELAQFILNHHEKWDGSGYPNGLKGEAIPLESRIITIADAYDAMTSERTYKTSISHEEAIKELMRCSGTQFDPAIVDVFVSKVTPILKGDK